MGWEYSKITDNLYIGTEMDFEEIPLLKEKLNIKYVIDLRAEYPTDGSEFSDLGMEFLGVGIFDIMPATKEQIVSVVEVYRKAKLENSNVYMFCSSGERRAPAMAIACLAAEGYNLEEAHKLVREKWKKTHPNSLQIEAVAQFAGDITRP